MATMAAKIVAILAIASVVYFIYRAFFNPVSAAVLGATKRQHGAAAGIVAAADAEASATRDGIFNFEMEAISAAVGVLVASLVLRFVKTKTFTGLRDTSMQVLKDATRNAKEFLNRGWVRNAVGVTNVSNVVINMNELDGFPEMYTKNVKTAWDETILKLSEFKGNDLSESPANQAISDALITLTDALDDITRAAALDDITRATVPETIFYERAQDFLIETATLIRGDGKINPKHKTIEEDFWELKHELFFGRP